MFETGEGRPPGNWNKQKSSLRKEMQELKEKLGTTHTRPLPEFSGQIDEIEIFGGKVTRKTDTPYAKGVHHEGRIDPEKVRVTPTSKPDANGVYQAKIEIRDPETGGWVEKADGSSMFPRSWSPERVLEEIAGARANASQIPGAGTYLKWRGISPGGIVIEGFMDASGTITSAFPKLLTTGG